MLTPRIPVSFETTDTRYGDRDARSRRLLRVASVLSVCTRSFPSTLSRLTIGIRRALYHVWVRSKANAAADYESHVRQVTSGCRSSRNSTTVPVIINARFRLVPERPGRFQRRSTYYEGT